MALATAVELSVKVKTPMLEGQMLPSVLLIQHYVKSNIPISGKVM